MNVTTERMVYAEYGRTLIIRASEMEDTNGLFDKVCAEFENTKIEQDADGNVYIMAPIGGESAYRNSELTMQLGIWSKANARGRSFGSSVLFQLPDGSKLCPDAAWVSNEKLQTLSLSDRRKFLKLAPEFVIELKSPSDSFSEMDQKMQNWIRNGVQLGWLIHPEKRNVFIYRNSNAEAKNSAYEVIASDELIADGPVEGFTLDLKPIWSGLSDL